MNSKRKVFSLLLILLLSISTLALPVAAEAKPPADDVIIYTSDPTEPPPATAPSTKPTTAATKPTEATAPAATAPTTSPTIPTISEPFEQGNAIASSLQYHKDTNKQFLTIETRSGEVFYIIIDYDAPVNENLEQFSAYFLNKVDNADLTAQGPASSWCLAMDKLPRFTGRQLRQVRSLIRNGFDYTLYDKDTFRLIDGGEIGSPEQHIYSACLAICDRHDLDSYAVKYASMELIEKLQEAQTVSSEQLPLPDPTITPDMTPDMAEHCGYTIPDMYPLSKDRAMELLEKDAVIFTLYPDKPAEMVFDAEDIVNHDGIFGITCEDWQNIHDTIPARDVHRRFLEAPGDAYAVMQLKGSAPAELRYTGLKYLSQPPSPGNYDILYTGPIVCTQNQSATLENLFEIFNINRPGDFTGHNLSVSDIIALKQDGVVSYHYCDKVGFQELPGFMSENYLKAAELSTEDDYGMIDGIINNGKQPTVADLEQQAKSGQPISLMDLADAAHREKKPSVLEKLKDQPQQPQRKSKPRKSKEQEI